MSRRPNTRRQRPAPSTFPDFSARFCHDFTSLARLNISERDITNMLKFCKTSKRGVARCGLEYQGRDSWIHLYATLGKREKNRIPITVAMHVYKPKGRANGTPEGDFESLLREIGKLALRAPVYIDASFTYPKRQFASAVRFPDRAGFQIPLASPVKVVGLRLEIEADAVKSVILDVGTPDSASTLVSSTLVIDALINEQLPNEILAKSSAVADRFVVRKKTSEQEQPS